MTSQPPLSPDQRMIVYQQNVETFRSLNQLMWQIPLIAMTLTGGLWFGVSRADTSPLLQLSLLGLAAVGNAVLIMVLHRLRYVMSEYLDWLRDFDPDGFVPAQGVKLGERPATVRTLFQFMLGLATIVSLALMINTAAQAKWFSADASQTRAVAYYNRNAVELADRYEGLSFEAAHPELAATLAGAAPLRILDVGSGSGRDAAAMDRLGHRVTAVEPSDRMRRLSQTIHASAGVAWVDDALPTLQTLRSERFDVILLSAVWMHIEPSRRAEAFNRLAELLAPGGRLYITLRVGPAAKERAIFAVSEQELSVLAKRRGLSARAVNNRPDLLGRPEVRWQSLVVTER